jgi:hypothetical protein
MKMGLGNPVALPHLQTHMVMDDWRFYLTGAIDPNFRKIRRSGSTAC